MVREIDAYQQKLRAEAAGSQPQPGDEGQYETYEYGAREELLAILIQHNRSDDAPPLNLTPRTAWGAVRRERAEAAHQHTMDSVELVTPERYREIVAEVEAAAAAGGSDGEMVIDYQFDDT